MKSLDQFQGCLIGGAVGDALGYAVEFDSLHRILASYGKDGITRYHYRNGVAEISDDTQMTLFTATGLLAATTGTLFRPTERSYAEYLHDSYSDWYRTQCFSVPFPGWEAKASWLGNVAELYQSRAPGNTCLSALATSKIGTMDHPLNHSKGCGGVMRVAPIGLYFAQKPWTVAQVDELGAQAAALTHGHPLGYIPAAGLVHLIQLLSQDKEITVADAVADMMDAMAHRFRDSEDIGTFTDLMHRAVALAADPHYTDKDAIAALGEGWVAEETLAIAVYCGLRYAEDFEKAVIAAVNHNGDSDSTGAVTGNILGAHLGLSGIPAHFLEGLECKDLILEIAADLYNDCPAGDSDPLWRAKYLDCTYGKRS